jgi:hypothetical protein
MSRVGRLAGALLVHSGSDYFLVGDLKEPCDFAAAGFEPPGEIDGKARPYVRLSPTREVALAPPVLTLELEGEELAELLSRRLVIERNGSVSERLLRVVMHGHDGKAEVPARWLGEIPEAAWQVVRDNILKCS